MSFFYYYKVHFPQYLTELEPGQDCNNSRCHKSDLMEACIEHTEKAYLCVVS